MDLDLSGDSNPRSWFTQRSLKGQLMAFSPFIIQLMSLFNNCGK